MSACLHVFHVARGVVLERRVEHRASVGALHTLAAVATPVQAEVDALIQVEVPGFIEDNMGGGQHLREVVDPARESTEYVGGYLELTVIELEAEDAVMFDDLSSVVDSPLI